MIGDDITVQTIAPSPSLGLYYQTTNKLWKGQWADNEQNIKLKVNIIPALCDGQDCQQPGLCPRWSNGHLFHLIEATHNGVLIQQRPVPLCCATITGGEERGGGRHWVMRPPGVIIMSITVYQLSALINIITQQTTVLPIVTTLDTRLAKWSRLFKMFIFRYCKLYFCHYT